MHFSFNRGVIQMRKRKTFRKGMALFVSLVILFGMTCSGVPTFAGETEVDPVETVQAADLNEDLVAQDDNSAVMDQSSAEASIDDAGDTGDPVPEEPKQEAPQPEEPQPEAPQPEAPLLEEPQPEAPQPEAPKLEGLQSAAPQLEAPKLDDLKLEVPQLEALKLDDKSVGGEPSLRGGFAPIIPDPLEPSGGSPSGKINYNLSPLTSFPAQAPPSGSKANSSHPTEPGEVKLFKYAEPVDGMVNVWDITLRIEGKDKPTTSDIVLVIDRSGSMLVKDGAGVTRMQAAKNAAKHFVDKLLPSTTTRIAVVSFASDFSTEIALTNDKEQLISKIDGLKANGGTFTQAGVKQAQVVLDSVLENDKADNNYIVVLSDGVPTFNYRINNRNNYLIDGGPGIQTYEKQTSTLVPASEFLYTQSATGAGNSMWYQYDAVWVSGHYEYRYYNSGNCAIAEAGFAGKKGTNIFTVGLQTEPIGSGVLNDMVQGSGTFTEVKTLDQLNPVFEAIAGQIGAAVKNAKIADPMGGGFQIPAGEVSKMIATQGTPIYDAATKKITWNPGTLTEPIEAGSDIRFAQLKYTVEINDDILDVTPDASGKYPTNGDAKIEYVDANGKLQEKRFPVPEVNPVFYKVVKELRDKDDKVITADRNFTIDVSGRWGMEGTAGKKSYTLNPKTQAETNFLTDLRWKGEYKFSEDVGALTDYEIEYYVNGVKQTGATPSFTIVDGNTEDVVVKVVNKEKPGSLTITKVVNQSSTSQTATGSFNFIVTGPNDYTQTFDLSDGDSKVLDGLAKGTYTIKEITTGWFTTIKVNDGTPVIGNSSSVTIDVGALNQSVTVTNSPIDLANITSLRFEKKWEGVPSGVTPPPITVQLKANGNDYGSAKTLTYPNTVLEWKNLPLNDEDGNPIVYTVEELPINNFEEGAPAYTESSIEAVRCTPGQNQTDWPLQNPTFVITRLTGGPNQPFVVWTLNHVPTADRISFLRKVIAASKPDHFKQPLKDLEDYLNSGGDYFLWFEGATVNEDVRPDDPNKGQITINITFKDDGSINTSTLTFEGESTWTHFAVGGYSSKLAEITNTYKATGSWAPVVTKVLAGRELKADEFSFQLKDSKGDVLQTKKNASDNKVTFDAIPYTQADIGKTYTYTINEVEGDLGGVTYDNKVVTVSVTIDVDSSGNLTFSPTYSPDTVFNNKYAADDATATISGTKELTGRALKDGEFTFELYACDAEGKIADGAVALDSTTNASGKFSFTLTYKDGQEGTYYYAVKEKDEGLGGVSYDTSVFVYKVEVTDDGAGKLVAKVSDPLDSEFNNSYAASGDWAAKVTKALEGRDLKADEFSFQLKDSEGKVLQTKKNSVDGDVTFDPIAYTEKDAGKTYTYTIVEALPDAPECGMEYDLMVVTITVTVEDAGDGTLKVTPVYSDDTEFNNNYDPEKVNVFGKKNWDDNYDQDGKRPESITIRLFADGVEIDHKVVTEADGWVWGFTDLMKYDDWVEIEYSVKEDPVPGYDTSVDGYNVTNTHEPSKISIDVLKRWMDNDDEAGLRPESITIRLFADNVDTGKMLVLTEDVDWAGTFSDLDEYKDGEKIVYTVKEDEFDSRYD